MLLDPEMAIKLLKMWFKKSTRAKKLIQFLTFCTGPNDLIVDCSISIAGNPMKIADTSGQDRVCSEKIKQKLLWIGACSFIKFYALILFSLRPALSNWSNLTPVFPLNRLRFASVNPRLIFCACLSYKDAW